MGWPHNPRLARSLTVLRDEINERWPRRDRASDGALGDEDHASRTSDHNPWILDPKGTGVVRAVDITHDPHAGPNNDALAERLRALGKAGWAPLQNHGYLIWDGRYCSALTLWEWRAYTGISRHEKHLHVSVSRLPAEYDSAARWNVDPIPPRPPSLEELLSMELTDKIRIPASYASNRTDRDEFITVEDALRRMYEWTWKLSHPQPPIV